MFLTNVYGGRITRGCRWGCQGLEGRRKGSIGTGYGERNRVASNGLIAAERLMS